MIDRPCTDPKLVLLDAFDSAWQQFRQRLDGLGDEEYRWEPTTDCWTVRQTDAGPRVDGAGDREADPPPFTTIAWRLWHITVDCLTDYSERLLGKTGTHASGDNWYLGAADALADLDRSWECWREGTEALTPDQWWDVLGEQWGPFNQHSVNDLVLHALHEVTHHGAEIGTLRDLYRSTNLDS